MTLNLKKLDRNTANMLSLLAANAAANNSSSSSSSSSLSTSSSPTPPTSISLTGTFEGYAKKAALSKGDDVCRGNWQERWFSLKQHELFYYKKREDNTPKGMIDMRAARIDGASESSTGKPFCIRIAQAKQVFVYIQFNSDDERERWVTGLRLAAGYKDNLSLAGEMIASTTVELPSFQDRMESYVSFPLLLLLSADAEHPERVTLAVGYDVTHGAICRIVKNDNVYSSYKMTSLHRIDYSQKAELRLVDTAGVHDLYTSTLVFKIEKSSGVSTMVKYQFYVGSQDDAKIFTSELKSMGRGDLSLLKKLQSSNVIQSGYIEYGDTSAGGGWLRRFCVVLDRRIIMYKTSSSVIPTWIVPITNQIYREAKIGIRVSTAMETVILKFESEVIRDQWLANLLACGRTIGDKLSLELKMFDDEEAEEKRIKDEKEKKQKYNEEQLKAKAQQEKNSASNDYKRDAKGGIGQTLQGDIKAIYPMCEALQKGEPGYIIGIGAGDGGQLGHRVNSSSVLPVLVDSLLNKNVRQLSCGRDHSACVTEAGHVFLWGIGKNFQLGMGERMMEAKAPVLNTSLLRFGAIQYISCGADHTLALSMGGEVYSWGNGAMGQLGQGGDGGKIPNSPYPQPVSTLKGKPICYVSAGKCHSAFIGSENKDLYFCGTNSNGCLGLSNCPVNTVISFPMPNTTINQVGKVVAVQCSNNFTLAILSQESSSASVTPTTNRKLFAWGSNNVGQLGVGDQVDRLHPTIVQFPGKVQPQILHIACGMDHSVALVENSEQKNSIYTWGSPISNGFREPQSYPTLVTSLDQNEKDTMRPIFISSSHSATHSVVVNSQGNTFAFGRNEFGELGNGASGVEALVKVRINNAIKVCQTACGKGFTLILAKGTPPAKLTSQKIQAESKGNNGSDLPSDMMVDVPDDGPSLDDASVQIAKLLQLEADRATKAGTAPEVKIQPGKIEILNTKTTGNNNYASGAVAQVTSAPSSKPSSKPTSNPSSSSSTPRLSGSSPAPSASSSSSPTSISSPPSSSMTITSQQAKTQLAENPNLAASLAAAAAKLNSSMNNPNVNIQTNTNGNNNTSTISANISSSSSSSSPTTPSDPPVFSPMSSPPMSPTNSGSASASPVPKKSSISQDLPPNWRRVKDEKSGRYYYYHTLTKQTSWKRPTEQA